MELLPQRKVAPVVEATTEKLHARLQDLPGADTFGISQRWRARASASAYFRRLVEDEFLSDEAIHTCLEILLRSWPERSGPPEGRQGILRRRREADAGLASAVAIQLDAALDWLPRIDRDRLVAGLVEDFFSLRFDGGSMREASRLARRSRRFREPNPSAASTNWW